MTAADLAVLAGHAAGAALHLARLLPVTLLCPLLGGPAAPAIVRVGLAAALGASTYAAAAPHAVSAHGLVFVALAVRELAVGTVLAFLSCLPFDAARAGGRLVDTLRGATLSELHVAPLRQRESAAGDLLSHWTVVLAASSGGDRLVVAALLQSFHAVPAGAPLRGDGLAAVLLGGAELLGCAVSLAAPAAAGLVAADLAVSAAARLGPALGIAAVLQPARAAVGVLGVALPAALVAGRITALVATSAGLVRAFAGGAP